MDDQNGIEMSANGSTTGAESSGESATPVAEKPAFLYRLQVTMGLDGKLIVEDLQGGARVSTLDDLYDVGGRLQRDVLVHLAATGAGKFAGGAMMQAQMAAMKAMGGRTQAGLHVPPGARK